MHHNDMASDAKYLGQLALAWLGARYLSLVARAAIALSPGIYGTMRPHKIACRVSSGIHDTCHSIGEIRFEGISNPVVLRHARWGRVSVLFHGHNKNQENIPALRGNGIDADTLHRLPELLNFIGGQLPQKQKMWSWRKPLESDDLAT